MKSPLRRLHAESKILATGACALALLLAAAPARALNIVLVYDDLGENPDWDPNGTALMAVAQAAAARWERLIPSPGTHTIDVSWSELDDDQLGLWKFDPFGNNNIYFDANTDWFIDSSPNSDSEFDFGDPFQFTTPPGSFFAGPNPSSLWFDGTDPPELLEVAHFGNGINGEAHDDFDLLSVILHEMGHELGVAGDEFSGRYPLYPDHVLGLRGVEVIEGNAEGDDGGIGYYEEHGHLAPPFALMSPLTPPGVRTLPSAVDVLVAARDSNYTSVDLVRKFAGRPGDWGDALDWIGGRVPDADDTVFIVHGGTTTLSGARTADSVSIDDDSLLDAVGDLTIDRQLRIGSTGKLRSAFGSEISAATLDGRFLSEIELTGGRLVLGGGTLAQNAKISGRGTVETSGTLRIDGLVDAINTDLAFRGPGTLRLSHPADEDALALLRARDGNIGLETSFTSDSIGKIEVFGGRNLTALADVTIPAGVQVHLHDSTGGPAIINSIGANVDITIRNLYVGDTNGVPGNTEIHSRTVTLENVVNVHGPLTLASSVLTTLRGGLDIYDGFSSNGQLVQAGDISVEGGEVSISVHEFDWGNSTSSKTNSINIHQNSKLRVVSSTLGSITNQFRGNIQIDSGVLDVNFTTPWDLPAPVGTTPGGTLAMIHSGTADPVVRGAPFTARDYLLVSGGDAFIEASLTVAPTATVVVFGNSSLFLDGHTTLLGGSYTGLGSLIQRGDIDVVASTTIAVEEFAWGNSLGLDFHTLTVHQGATLTVDSPGTGDPDNQFRGLVRLEGGDLVVNTDAGWTLPAGGLLQFPGTLELHNNGTIPRLLGQPATFGAGVAVTGGAARIGCETFFQTTSQIDIAAGATLHMDGATTYRGTVTGAGTLQHNGSALLSSTTLTIPHMVQHGLLTAIALGGEAKLLTHTLDFAAGSETRLHSDLRISGIASVTAGATFTSTGTLIVTESLSGTGTIGVGVRNEGTLQPGAGAGLLSISGNYTQTGTGTLAVEIGGTTVSLFDRLSITGTAALSGGLNVSLTGGFVPPLGQKFQILAAPGGVSGAFTTLTQPAGMPGNLAFSIVYTASAVFLTVVPTTPYQSWINSFGEITDPAKKAKDADPDNDGLSNRAEFALDENPASGLATGKVVVKIASVGHDDALTLTLPVRAEARPDRGDPAGGELVLTQSADAVTWTIQASGDAARWSGDVTEVTGPDASTIQLGLPVLNAGWVYRTFRSPGTVAGNSRGFIRAVIGD